MEKPSRYQLMRRAIVRFCGPRERDKNEEEAQGPSLSGRNHGSAWTPSQQVRRDGRGEAIGHSARTIVSVFVSLPLSFALSFALVGEVCSVYRCPASPPTRVGEDAGDGGVVLWRWTGLFPARKPTQVPANASRWLRPGLPGLPRGRSRGLLFGCMRCLHRFMFMLASRLSHPNRGGQLGMNDASSDASFSMEMLPVLLC
ncbi:hypothetical protein G7046_g1675 [Stylonectria norvegica]|nr:hypothetical protein G7046_g1675 [Stylonectria norvegica]